MNKKVGGLGWLDWFVLGVLLVFTSAGTAGMVAITSNVTGLALLLRQAAAVCFTDGILIYWQNRRGTYADETQRTYATRALWVSVSVVLLFTVSYGIESVLLGAGGVAEYTVDAFGAVMPLAELLGFTVSVVLGLQAAGTLALILYIEQLNPSAKMLIAQRQAEGEINERQLADYATAQKSIAGVVGQAQAMVALRAQLAELGYNEKDAEVLVNLAMQKIQNSKAAVGVQVEGQLAENFFGLKQ